MLIDIHSHIKYDQQTQQYDEADLLSDMAKYKIDQRVVSTLEGTSTEAINTYISDLAIRYSDKIVGAAVINPKEVSCVEETKRVLGLPGIKFIEFNSVEHGYYPDDTETLDQLFELISQKEEIAVKMFTGIGSRSLPQQWLKYVKRYPNLKFIFLHMGCFDYGYGCIDVVEKYDNLFVETSNQYEVQILKKCFNQLSGDKVVFGSLYPERLTKCSIDVFEMFHLSDDYLNAVYYETAIKKFNL